ncbi:hypothetical protein BO94DRAFT_529966 [Aspergillus sclerotioniger CBS 115572]|uniref:Uncharacterized protein n=1 Tax=Aspergillus sclerotioniger CBS 115572 TaxID=1450535 RepID=A0A317XD97_9EURO|nr:hypothetical protein BO94DRAFT_529966 [Aspergillus sclerotioniger CBS 115572]PWY96596.1 hypothetical protein BO94DRAFT_529966 [Aspergillus sclerotioniger CBS 115572]
MADQPLGASYSLLLNFNQSGYYGLLVAGHLSRRVAPTFPIYLFDPRFVVHRMTARHKTKTSSGRILKTVWG